MGQICLWFADQMMIADIIYFHGTGNGFDNLFVPVAKVEYTAVAVTVIKGFPVDIVYFAALSLFRDKHDIAFFDPLDKYNITSSKSFEIGFEVWFSCDQLSFEPLVLLILYLSVALESPNSLAALETLLSDAFIAYLIQ